MKNTFHFPSLYGYRSGDWWVGFVKIKGGWGVGGGGGNCRRFPPELSGHAWRP